MNSYKASLIEEHKALAFKVNALEVYITSGKGIATDTKIEYANKVAQLNGMKQYLRALTARLINVGIVVEGITYFENVGNMNSDITEESFNSAIQEINIGQPGSDFDLDKSSSPVRRCECDCRNGLCDEKDDSSDKD